MGGVGLDARGEVAAFAGEDGDVDVVAGGDLAQ